MSLIFSVRLGPGRSGDRTLHQASIPPIISRICHQLKTPSLPRFPLGLTHGRLHFPRRPCFHPLVPLLHPAQIIHAAPLVSILPHSMRSSLCSSQCPLLPQATAQRGAGGGRGAAGAAARRRSGVRLERHGRVRLELVRPGAGGARTAGSGHRRSSHGRERASAKQARRRGAELPVPRAELAGGMASCGLLAAASCGRRRAERAGGARTEARGRASRT